MSDTKLILGFTGLLASGKGAASTYLKNKYGAEIFSFSRMLRDVLDRFYLGQTRDNLTSLSEILRHQFGENILAKTMAQDVAKSSNPIIVVEGIRRLADIEYLRQLPNFILVEVAAKPEIRYKRLTQRHENLDDQTKTYEQFLADHELPTELSTLEVIKLAIECLDNNGDKASLQQQLDKLIEKYKKQI